MSILKLALDQRYEIALKSPVPQESNRFGKQFMYTLAAPSNHVLYVPPAAHAEIQSLHVEPGELFSVKKSIGPDNAHAWDVQRIHAEELQPKPMGAAVAISSPKPQSFDPPNLTTEESKRIFRQLVAVIDACNAAEKYSNQIDYPVSFGPEDIRAMAISGFIEQSRRNAA